MVHVAALLVGLALAGAPPDATASPRFERCFDAARQALTDGAAAPARTGFQACLAFAAPGPERWRALLGLALARHGAGDLPLALATYQRFLDDSRAAETPPWPERRHTATREAESLRARVLETHAEVVVRSATPGAEVTVSGVALAEVQRAAPSFIYLPPGRHTLTVRAADHAALELPVEVAVGDAIALRADLAPIAPPTPPTVDDPDPADLPGPPYVSDAGDAPVGGRVLDSAPGLEPTVDYTPHALIGGGVAVVAVGAVFTVLALGDVDRLEELQRLPRPTPRGPRTPGCALGPATTRPPPGSSTASAAPPSSPASSSRSPAPTPTPTPRPSTS